jgi:molybdate transport system substrate-binding protein
MARAADDGRALTGISSMATRAALAELAQVYARAHRLRVDVAFVGGVDASRRVQDGEAFDFVVLASDAVARLAQLQRVDARTRRDLASSDVAIAVRAGAACPDVGSERALCEPVLAARTIGYSTGPSGIYLVRLFERLGVAQTVAARLVQAPPGVPVASLIARGDVELGFQQLSELLHAPGVDVVGLLPPAMRHTTVFSGAVCTAAARPREADALLAFLASDAATDAKRRHGLAPAGER